MSVLEYVIKQTEEAGAARSEKGKPKSGAAIDVTKRVVCVTNGVRERNGLRD